MQIVIDIDERRFKDILRISTVQLRGRTPTLEQVIAKGIPLPEHHGRLGDLDKLYTEMNNGIKAGNYEDGYESYGHINDTDDCLECVKYADTIIEADKEEEQ